MVSAFRSCQLALSLSLAWSCAFAVFIARVFVAITFSVMLRISGPQQDSHADPSPSMRWESIDARLPGSSVERHPTATFDGAVLVLLEKKALNGG